MKRYLEYCAPATTTCGPVLTLADCGGFLLRNYLHSQKSNALPQDVLTHIECVWPMLGHPFIALHVAGLYASAADQDGLKKCCDTLMEKDASSNRETSLNLVNALSAYVDKDFKKCNEILGELPRESRIGIGGSNVERELVDLIEASAKTNFLI